MKILAWLYLAKSNNPFIFMLTEIYLLFLKNIISLIESEYRCSGTVNVYKC